MVKKTSTETHDGELVNSNRSNQNNQKVYGNSSNFNRSNQNRQNPSTSRTVIFKIATATKTIVVTAIIRVVTTSHVFLALPNGRVCYRCNKKNNLASCCKSKNSEQANDIFDVSSSTEEESSLDITVGALSSSYTPA